MMREYQVIGADRETGEDRVIVIEARHEQHAEEQAARMNVMVSRVKMLDAGRPAMQSPEFEEPPRHWIFDRATRRMFSRYMISNVAIGSFLGVFVMPVLVLTILGTVLLVFGLLGGLFT